MLGNDADEALDGAEDHTVDHHGAVLLTVGPGVLQLEALRQLHIQLDGAALPGAAQGVLEMEVQLGAVEGAVPLVDDVALAHLGDGLFQSLLGEFPILLVPHVILRHGGQLYLVGQAEEGVDLVKETGHVLYLVLHLVPGHEDVGIVLGEAADAEQPVEGAGELMAVHHAQFAHSQRQIPVGVGLGLVHQHAAGAVHGFDGIVLPVDEGGVHVLLIVEPVAGSLPQLAVKDHGSGNLHIAVALVDLTPVVDQGVFQHHALGQEEGEAGAFVGEHEQAQLLAQLPVIPALGLLDPLQIGVQLVLLGEGHAVDALEGLAVGIAPPVGAVAGSELDGVALDPAGGVQMGAGTEVGELTLSVEADDGVLRQVVDQLHLVRLALFLHELQGFLPGQLKALQLQLLLADLAHLALDLFHDLRGEGKGRVHVIVKAVVDGRADGQLHLRVQALHSLGQDVGAGVPIGTAVFFVLKAELVFIHCKNFLL